MRETIHKVTCDRCGADIEDRGDWGLKIDRWEKDQSAYVTWNADFCDECKEVLVSAIFNLGIKLRYTKE